MLPSNADYTTKPGIRQTIPSITQFAVVPALIENEGSDTKRRFVEFFTANISNPNTRAAYLRAVTRFCHWYEARELTLHQTEPTLLAFYVKELGQKHSRPTVKQHLAAIRMLFD